MVHLLWSFLQKLKVDWFTIWSIHHSPYGCIPQRVENRISKRYLCSKEYYHNSWRLEATQMSFHERMDQHHVVYICSRILCSLKKTGNSDVCYNMKGPWGYDVKQPQPITRRQILHDSTSVNFRELSNYRDRKQDGGFPGAEVKGKVESYHKMGTKF